LERAANDHQHSIDVFTHIVIPKPQHTLSISFKIRVTFQVPLNSGRDTVLPAIDLDHQFRRMTGKVGEVRSYCCLPPKVRTF